VRALSQENKALAEQIIERAVDVLRQQATDLDNDV